MPRGRPRKSAAELIATAPGYDTAEPPFFIPSTNALVSIEHPVILSSIQTGIKSLGGHSALTKAMNEETPELELRYNRDDVYRHPIVSQAVPVKNIVVKMVRSKQSQQIEDVEIVGVVKNALRFRGKDPNLRHMADFQYHPLPDSKFAAKFEEAFSDLSYDKLASFDISMEEDDLSHLDTIPPPTFSRTVLPHFYNYKQNTGLEERNGRLSYIYNSRHKFTTMVDKEISTPPLQPSPTLVPLAQTPQAMQHLVSNLRKFFKDRPITTRRAIFNMYLSRHGLGDPDSVRDNWRPILRHALPYVCYMFKSGPYRDAYVVFGVDPRKEQRWAKYQTAFFHFRQGKGRVAKGEDGDGKGLWEMRNSHLFTGKDVGTRVVCYSFVDIVDPIMRKLIDESPLRERFHENDGWYPAETLLRVRKIMRAKLLALREGRILSDEELIPILEDVNMTATAAQEDRDTSARPENDVPEEDEADDDEDDNQMEGENEEEEKIEDDQELKNRLEELMKDLVKPPREHLTSIASFVHRRRRSRKTEDTAKVSTGGRTARHRDNNY